MCDRLVGAGPRRARRRLGPSRSVRTCALARRGRRRLGSAAWLPIPSAAHAPAAPPLVLLEAPGAPRPPRRGTAPAIVHVVATRPDAVTLAPVVAALAAARRVPPARPAHGSAHGPGAGRGDVRRPRAPRARPLRLDAGRGQPRRADRAGAGRRPRRCWPSCGPPPSWSPERRTRRSAARCAAAKLGRARSRASRPGCASTTGRVPEEVNRVLLDTMADTLFAPTPQAVENLRGGGRRRRAACTSSAAPRSTRCAARERRARRREAWRRFGARARRATCSSRCTARPTSTTTSGSPGSSRRSPQLARRVPVVFPLHPRTRERLKPMGDAHRLLAAGVLLRRRRSRYLDFLSLQLGRGRGRDRLGDRAGGDLGARRALLHAARRRPSARSRSPTAPTRCSATTRATSPTCARPRRRRRRARSRCGTAAPATGSPTRWSANYALVRAASTL